MLTKSPPHTHTHTHNQRPPNTRTHTPTTPLLPTNKTKHTPTHRSSSTAIAVLYKSHFVKTLEVAVEALWDVADQVSADAAGCGRALRAAMQAASDLARWEFKAAAPPKGEKASQGPASQAGVTMSAGRVVVGPLILPMLHLIFGLSDE